MFTKKAVKKKQQLRGSLQTVPMIRDGSPVFGKEVLRIKDGTSKATIHSGG